MPARTAAAENLDNRRVRILRERRNWHGPRSGHPDQGGAGEKGNDHKILHEHSPISRLGKMTTLKMMTLGSALHSRRAQMGMRVPGLVHVFTRL
ncbi:hypothetical protein [Bradyrhizobium sp. S69]|uniref:hypothetical protein n=1 Tax=Bradyrhizobium sp. S69 TaxID=1641856 RepID=UPI00131DB6E7|nr:hypothetical protein [Bradyrhizobium sp. S69]